MQNGAAAFRQTQQRHTIIQIRLHKARAGRQWIRERRDIGQAQLPAKRAKALRKVTPQRTRSAGE